MRKTLTLAEFTALNLTIDNDYRNSEIQYAKNKAEEWSKFIPCEPLFIVDEEEGQNYFQYAEIKIVDPLQFVIKYESYRKKFHIYCRSIDLDFKNIDRYTIERERKKLTEPNQIGVLTTKKINDWLNYYRELHKALSEINKANSNEIETFLKSIEGLSVKWWNNKKQGEIVMGGLVFKFHIHETYVSTEIEKHYETGRDLQTFLKLSKNHYAK